MSRESVGRESVRGGESRPSPKTVDWDNAPSRFKLETAQALGAAPAIRNWMCAMKSAWFAA